MDPATSTILPQELVMDILYKFDGLGGHPVANLLKPHLDYAWDNICECYYSYVDPDGDLEEMFDAGGADELAAEQYYTSMIFDSIVNHPSIDPNKFPNHKHGQIYYKGTCVVNPDIYEY